MKTNSARKSKQNLRLAVPYYGTLTQPTTGLARLFFLADIDLEQGPAQRGALKLLVWNSGKHARLADWLRAQNVYGLLCREIDGYHLRQLTEEGFWVAGGWEGDAEQMVASCLDVQAFASSGLLACGGMER